MEETALPTYFGEWHKHRRKILDLTQAEVATRAQCSVPALRKIEAGERRPSKQLAVLLAESLDILPEDKTLFVKVARGELNVERLYAYISVHNPVSPLVLEPTKGKTPLPVQSTLLIGRQIELDSLKRLLVIPDCRLLTIIGMGGIGKTRLAVELAASQQAFYPSGVHHIRLAPLNSSELIITTIATSIGLSFSGSLDPKEQLLNFLTLHTPQPRLLVLDHLEHLLVPSSPSAKNNTALFLAELLHRVPNLTIIATSIERINIQGEWVFELHELPFPTSEQSANVENYDAAVLFIKRAQQVKVDFQLKPTERSSLTKLCQLVQGVPLAIELAAAWAGMLSVSEIAQEIENNLDFLTTSLRDIPERHRSLRAVFENSCKLLLQEDYAVLCKLSLFRGGFTRDAAARVANATLETLSTLISKSFLYRSEAGRYHLHDVIRLFALEKLHAAGIYQETCNKFLESMLALTLEAQDQLRGSRQTEWLNLLEREYDNLRTALEWAFFPNTSTERIEQGLQLVMSITRFLQARGYVREGIAWLERGLDEKNMVSAAIRAKALGLAGWLAIYLNDSQRARNMLRQSIAIYRDIDDQSGLAKALDNLGDIAWFIGDYAESMACYDESLTMLRKLGDPCSIGLSLYSIGRLHVDYGFYQQAEANFQEALSLLKAIPDLRGVAMCTNGLGRLALFQDRHEEALNLFRDAVRMNYELGHKIALTECLRELAVVALLMDQEPRAIQLLAASTRLQKDLGIAFPPVDPINHMITESWIELITPSSDWLTGYSLSFEQAIEYALGNENLVKL